MTFAELRRVAPVSRQPAGGFEPGRGAEFWAVTRHAEVQLVSRQPEVYGSGQGVGLADLPIELLELNGSFLAMDAPRHANLRRIVSGAFAPRRLAQLESEITTQANAIVDEFVDRGGGDVVEDLAKKLPLWTICTMMGVPEEMRADLYRAAEAQMTSQDPEFSGGGVDAGDLAAGAAMTMHRMARDLVAARRARPGDDIMSAMAESVVDGRPLSAREIGGLFVLFATAGNETSRDTTSHGIRLFADNPEQWSRLVKNTALVHPAVEEIIRCATPVIQFRRTAMAATRLANVAIQKGDWVVLFYESANRDERVFANPERFDIARYPNPHVGFGGGGPHFCLGAGLARLQLRALLARLAERAATVERGEPHYLLSSFVHGIKRMPVTVTPLGR